MRRLVRVAMATTALAAVAGCAAPTAQATRPFDLQAHRGGAALTVENTLAAFSRALDLGVSTLELDTQITEDGYAVVTHDRDPDPRKCTDTSPRPRATRPTPTSRGSGTSRT
jgi:glycerophosphoryl diester phosphodiesterase